MKKIFLIALTMAAVIGCGPKEKWTDLFNGENLDGWEVKGADEANFYVEDGMLVAETEMGVPNVFLVTSRPYANFELELDFKAAPGINSGVQIRSSVHEVSATTRYVSGSLEERDRDWTPGTVRGYQIEIDPSERAWTGGFYEEGGRGWLVPLADNVEAGEAFNLDEWNHFRIVANGNSFQTWINGVLAVDTTDDLTSTGFIGLQLHSIKTEEKAGRKTLFKNIRIRDLK